ncbi:hepatic sodium/bile acid cotransporter [Bactrocera oleae]|uniref:hepatic sodium/bile acid cotransporter n=1 Tax=Bactrocera oleae TaxID=104688 RepID=UPI00387E6C4C
MKQVATLNCSRLIFMVVICFAIPKCYGEVQGQYGEIAGAWDITYQGGGNEQLLTISKDIQYVNLVILNVDLTSGEDFHFEVHAGDPKLALIEKRIERSELAGAPASWQGQVPVQTRHFGFTTIYVTLNSSDGVVERSPSDLTLIIARKDRLDEKIFTYTASALLLLMFLNLGGVLDLERLKAIMLRPIAVTIGFCTSYILMPLLAIAIGYCFLSKHQELHLALFFTALSPSGGLANICAIFLKGNVNLSIATTTINSLMSLAIFPLWILILMRTIFTNTELDVPFLDLAGSATALVCAIALGMLSRVFLPKTTSLIFRFLKPFCACLSLCLIAMTVGINAFAFKELTGMIFLAALFLPISGYILSYGISKLLRCSAADALTISIETSVLNMTVPIMLLQHCFDEVRADMTLIVPIMAALISLAMMIVIYTIRRIFGWNKNIDGDVFASKVELVSFDENIKAEVTVSHISFRNEKSEL